MIKELARDDPMELVGVGLPEGDVDHMAECVVEEYMLMGWSEGQLMSLFTRPFFQMTHRIYRENGEEYVRALIRRVGEKWRRQSNPRGARDA